MNCYVKITKPDEVGCVELDEIVQALFGYSWHLSGTDYTRLAIADHMKIDISQLMRAGSRASDAFQVSVDDDGGDEVTVSFTVSARQVKA